MEVKMQVNRETLYNEQTREKIGRISSCESCKTLNIEGILIPLSMYSSLSAIGNTPTLSDTCMTPDCFELSHASERTAHPAYAAIMDKTKEKLRLINGESCPKNVEDFLARNDNHITPYFAATLRAPILPLTYYLSHDF